MGSMQRLSPARLPAQVSDAEIRDGWQVVTAYGDEGQGPWLIDLSHRARWDIQAKTLSQQAPFGLKMPPTIGASWLRNGMMINRMNRTQASIYHLAGDAPIGATGPETTDVTDATVFLALVGPHVFAVAEKLSSLDLLSPERQPPFLLQGPLSHVPCQLVVVDRNDAPIPPHPAERGGALLMTCSRGYAQDMVEAILAAGEEFGLRPAGEHRFSHWLEEYQARTT